MDSRQRRSADSAQDPAWADLPVEIWRRIAMAATHYILHNASDHARSLGSWLAGLRCLVSMSQVSWGLCKAVLGPGAGILWDWPRFCASYPGLSQQQAQRLNKLQTRRCRALQGVSWLGIWGGGWPEGQLSEVCAGLPTQIGTLSIQAMDDAWEAAAVGSALVGCSVQNVVFHGQFPVAFPTSVQRIVARRNLDTQPTDAELLAFTELLMPQLVLLRNLRSLSLKLAIVRTEDIQLIRQHLPLLQSIDLNIYPSEDSASQHDLRSLQLLAHVQLRVTVIAWWGWQDMLQEMQQLELPLTKLQLMFPADELTHNEEMLLAGCCSCERLVLYFPDPSRRLTVPHPGLNIHYGQS